MSLVMPLTEVSVQKSAGGWHKQFSHTSNVLNCDMRFAVFLPPQLEQGGTAPVLYWLSGLTCTDENFMQKAGAHRLAAELGIIIVAPDTSPRGDDVPDDPEQAYDFGLGAGFYVDATEAPWSTHYNMYSYVVDELPQLINEHFPTNGKQAISGHSMGGHGALTIALRNPENYASASAFSPICNPMECPWGIKAFTNYLGEDQTTWTKHDASVLLKSANHRLNLPMLVDQGLGDNFLAEQLMPQALLDAATAASNASLDLRQHAGYDHSYYFISSFIDEHLRFHHKCLVSC